VLRKIARLGACIERRRAAFDYVLNLKRKKLAGIKGEL
jgi:hypothetical protein